MTYSHRNGDTEPPILAGHYWFRGKAFRSKFGYLLWVVKTGKDTFGIVVAGDTVSIDNYKGQWWGPLTPPWQDEN